MGLVHLTENNWEENMKDLFGDGDFDGENGRGYVRQEAIDEGYDSNLEYAIAKAKVKHPHDWKAAVKDVIEYFENHEGRYYNEVQQFELELGDDLIISLHTVTP